MKCDGTRAKTRFRLSAKRTSPFKSVGASIQSTAGSRGVPISGSNAGYTMSRGSVNSTGYPIHSPVSSSLPLPCVTVCHHISIGLVLKIHLNVILPFNSLSSKSFPHHSQVHMQLLSFPSWPPKFSHPKNNNWPVKACTIFLDLSSKVNESRSVSSFHVILTVALKCSAELNHMISRSASWTVMCVTCSVWTTFADASCDRRLQIKITEITRQVNTQFSIYRTFLLLYPCFLKEKFIEVMSPFLSCSLFVRKLILLKHLEWRVLELVWKLCVWG